MPIGIRRALRRRMAHGALRRAYRRPVRPGATGQRALELGEGRGPGEQGASHGGPGPHGPAGPVSCQWPGPRPGRGSALMLGPPGAAAPVPSDEDPHKLNAPARDVVPPEAAAPLPVAESHIIVLKAISNATVPSYQGSFKLHSK